MTGPSKDPTAPDASREALATLIIDMMPNVLLCCSGAAFKSEGHDQYPPCLTVTRGREIADAVLALLGAPEATARNGSRTMSEAKKQTTITVTTLPGSVVGEIVRRMEELPTGPWDREDGCFGHCDPEGWYAPCRSPEPNG